MSLAEESPAAGDSGGGGEFMLFGVRVKVDPMRKSVSMNNLSEYEPTSNLGENGAKVLPEAAKEGGEAVGYASADDVAPQPSGASGERKRGTPWTEEEHKLFLIGLQKVGKGDWRGISKYYVKTRTPTQVASHAQKNFLRRSNVNRRRRRSSLFDITTDSVAASMPVEEPGSSRELRPPPAPHPASLPPPVPSNVNYFSTMPFPIAAVGGPIFVSMGVGNPSTNSPHAQQNFQANNTSSPMAVHYVPVLSMPPPSSAMAHLNLKDLPLEKSPLSLRLSLSNTQSQSQSSYKNGDSSVSVA